MPVPHVTPITNHAESAGKQGVPYPPTVPVALKIFPEFRIGLGGEKVEGCADDCKAEGREAVE